MSNKTLTVRLTGLLHEGQREVAQNPARFKVVSAGRRWRKTALGVVMCAVRLLKGLRSWAVYPSYPMSQVAWRMAKNIAWQIPVARIKESERLVTIPGTGMFQVKSASDPDSLRGEGLDFVVLDEAALIKEEAWTNSLRPALADKKGEALFASTPKGRNWFWRLYERARQSDNGEWKAWSFPTSSNPYIDPSEIEAARELLPELVFLQEFLAQFLEAIGAVFRSIVANATAVGQEEQIANGEGRHDYAFGVDWGKHEDFTVLHVLDLTEKALVKQDRFRQIDYALQTRQLKALYECFHPITIIAERNAMGEPLIEQLLRDGLPVQPFLTTNASKAQAIDALALAFERGDIKIIPNQTLIAELQAYEAKRLPSGLLRYSAPEGAHDDYVMALALAWQAVAMGTPRIRWL